MIVFCAGCGKVVKQDDGHGSGSTHGCCDECNAALFRSQEHREVKAKPGIPGVVSGPPYPLPGEAGMPPEGPTYPLPGPKPALLQAMDNLVRGEHAIPPKEKPVVDESAKVS